MHESQQTLQDQLGRTVKVPQFPQKIISLVPSQTELLFDLGLDAEIAGITKFCIHPQNKIQGKPIVGGTKNFRFDFIDQLQPDLILANKEENYQEGVAQLAQKYPLWISDIENLTHAQEMIELVGAMVGRETQAIALNTEITEKFSTLPTAPASAKVAYLIWRKPYMAVGSNTFIDEMLKLCGFINPVAAWTNSRYPEVAAERLKAMDLQHIFLSSEPFPFQEKHIAEFQEICPNAQVTLVEGEMFSWYGSRLTQAPAYFTQLLDALNESVV